MEYKLVRKSVITSFKIQNFEKIIANYEIISMRGRWIEILLVSEDLLQIFQTLKNFRNPYFLGIHFGDLKGKKFKIGLEGITLIAKYVEEKSILTEKGEKKVLYGRDLRKKDLFDIPIYIKKDDLSILTNKDGDILGLGKYLFHREEIENLSENMMILKNIIDKGWYLRKGG